MRKPVFCICENKDTDQLRSNCAGDSAFVFATRIVQSLYFLNPKFHKALAIFCGCTVQVVSDLDPEERFSQNEAQL